ncbi:metalloregulator ArsR/SmtB family transcription factor [Rhizobium sp. S96]|jgi:DNA-binding transcriptional ArsR family regulator|uniref:ArsR/SmtB family transcription factor n=1 Tax=Rhizobium sp. S96 TaxID=3055140 RepID=UPI0025AA8354|nr:metalloregulator ArsR/SmtB family transcription factor [Rhizobium sp. S96]MDM9623245.1 metalloregulator ArsR/SmtB family transcription factor [Rhizobium sp. S96]
MNDDTALAAQAKLLALLANEKRLLIASHILDEEMSVNELAEKVGLSQSALSQHLAKFRAAKAVTTRRDAQTVYYSTSHEGVQKILEVLEQLFERKTATKMAKSI